MQEVQGGGVTACTICEFHVTVPSPFQPQGHSIMHRLPEEFLQARRCINLPQSGEAFPEVDFGVEC